MNQNIVKRNELLAQKVVKGLESRNMKGYYAATKEEALAIALSLIPKGSSVSMGGAMSAHEIGLVEAVKSPDYRFIDRDAWTDKRAAMLAAYDADVFLSSANAMTEDGILVNIDGNANRVSAIAQGPKKVVMIVGMNKVCDDVDLVHAHDQRPALRSLHSLQQDRRLHELQIPGHHLLPVPDHPLFPARRPDPRDPGQRQPGLLTGGAPCGKP